MPRPAIPGVPGASSVSPIPTQGPGPSSARVAELEKVMTAGVLHHHAVTSAGAASRTQPLGSTSRARARRGSNWRPTAGRGPWTSDRRGWATPTGLASPTADLEEGPGPCCVGIGRGPAARLGTGLVSPTLRVRHAGAHGWLRRRRPSCRVRPSRAAARAPEPSRAALAVS